MGKSKEGSPPQALRIWYYPEQNSLVETMLSPEQIFAAIQSGGEPETMLAKNIAGIVVGHNQGEWSCTLELESSHLIYIGEL